MTSSTPPWGNTGWKPSGDDGKFKPGVSGNPAGKPPGTLNRKTLVAQALDARAESVATAVVDKALEGDMQAARLVLERVHPPKRPAGNRVNFKFDPDTSMAQQARQVLAAMACGDIEVEIGQIFLNSLSTAAGIFEHDELSKRITELESAARAGAEAQGVLGKVMQTEQA